MAGEVARSAARARLLTDPHSLPFYRLNGIVRNVDAWYTAFGVNSAMRCILPRRPGAYLVNLKGAQLPCALLRSPGSLMITQADSAFPTVRRTT